ncbi:hypothetical protein BDQ17DRAFT_1233932 [Cyathus striatus]|nr:hypothetical protein BDQ17DRAFT_1233932 [Cyathus striatus]
MIDIFNCPPIYDSIFSCLSFPELIPVSLTCRLANQAVSTFCLRAYNINRHLSHFFSDPISFRNLQARTSTVISGSNAIQFLDRTAYPDADLDIFAARVHAEEVGHWILGEGYVFNPTPRQCEILGKPHVTFDQAIEKFKTGDRPPDNEVPEEQIGADPNYPFPGLADVYTFEKDGKKVQLINTRHNPVHCILHFHSTCVMNFIAFDAAYSLYPKATFVARQSVIVKDITAQDRGALDKYTARGWKIVTKPWTLSEEILEDCFIPDLARHPRDEYSWRLPLNTSDIQYHSLVNPVLYNSWSMAHIGIGFHMASHVIEHPKVLTYSYAVAPKQLKNTVDRLLRVYAYRYQREPLVKFDSCLCHDIIEAYFREVAEIFYVDRGQLTKALEATFKRLEIDVVRK